MDPIFKLQPNRTLALRGFDTFAAAAALHSATNDSFKVSGTFRDPADFAVLILYDADNFYEHPSIKYLPDFDFSGLVLQFDVQYSDGVQPIDSPKYNWIDWATLDCILVNDNPDLRPRVRLWDYATLVGGNFAPASGTFTLSAGSGAPKPGDRITLWFENLSFDYIVPEPHTTSELAFFAGVEGTAHSITINDRVYTHTEAAGESSADQASALIDAVNNGDGDPQVVASIGSDPNKIVLTLRDSATGGEPVNISASDDNASDTLGPATLNSIAASLRSQINVADWTATGRGLAVMAEGSGNTVVIRAARHGIVNSSGATVTWVGGGSIYQSNTPSGLPWSEKFVGLTADNPIRIAGNDCVIASVDSPMQLTLTKPLEADVQVAPYVAPRGGRDGNMFTLYSLSQAAPGDNTPNLTAEPVVQLTGGSSAATWRVRLDFSAIGIDQIRQCWLTFAPSLTNGAAYSDTDWLATFSNWTVIGDDSKRLLKIAGPGSVRVEESSDWCTYSGTGWAPKPGDITGGFYSNYAAAVSKNAGDSVTVTYQCPQAHDLYVGTALYTDRGGVTVQLDGNALPDLDCYLYSSSAIVTRRRLASNVEPGQHTVTLTSKGTGPFYFDFLEAAVLSDPQGPSKTFSKISPALDYDTDHTYKLSPARLMWNFDQLGFAGPINEYIGVFWWNQRSPVGGEIPQTVVTFDGTWNERDSIFLNINGDVIGKTIYPADTSYTIASHFAYQINAIYTGAWASAKDNALTIVSRSPAAPYSLEVTTSVANGNTGSGSVSGGCSNTTGEYPVWTIDPAKDPVINRGAADWHLDFYQECAGRQLEVTTAGSMELVYPPDGFAARYRDGTPVATATGFGTLVSVHCAVGASQFLAYQKRFYKAIADLQSQAGVTPSVQYGEFLWWFFAGADTDANPIGMAFYDAETTAAAQAALGRPLFLFQHPTDDPAVNNSADATFLRDRLRDHVANLVTDLRGYYPNAKIEVLFPYDVNYPQQIETRIVTSNALDIVGGPLNRFINLPLEWQQKETSGLDRIKVEALQFGTQFRSMDLVRQAVQLMPNFGWPQDSVRYLAPIFGLFQPWQTEIGLAFGQGLKVVNLWAFDHLCLYNLSTLNLREP